MLRTKQELDRVQKALDDSSRELEKTRNEAAQISAAQEKQNTELQAAQEKVLASRKLERKMSNLQQQSLTAQAEAAELTKENAELKV